MVGKSLKKIISLALAIIIIAVAGVAVFADSGTYLGTAIQDPYFAGTNQFLVTITRPQGNESTFNMSYLISGTTDQQGIEVVLARYNDESGVYEEFENADGLSRWEIGSFGFFTRELMLSEGTNKLKVIAYKKAEAGSLTPGVNLQVNYFTITVMKKSIRDLLINSYVNITDIFKGLFYSE